MTLNRIPVIALDYFDRENNIPIEKEMLVDYTNGDIYVKNQNGELISCTSKYADISSRVIELSDGTKQPLQDIINGILDNTLRSSSDISEVISNITNIESRVIKLGDTEFIPITSISAVYDENGESLLDIITDIKTKLGTQIMISSTQETITATEDNQKVFTLRLPGSSDYNFLNIHTTLAFNGITFIDNRHYDIIGNTLTIHEDTDGIMKDRDLTIIYLFSYYQKDVSNYLAEGIDGHYIRTNTITIDKLEQYSNDPTDDGNVVATAKAVYKAMQKANEAYDLAGTTPTHTHDESTINAIKSSVIQWDITDKIPIECIPEAAQKKLHTVANMTEMYALTSATVSIYDYVRVLDGGNGEPKMFLVIDTSKLANENGYQEFSGGDSIDWGHIYNRPSTLAGYGITDGVKSDIVSETSAAGKLVKVNNSNKLPVNISGDADTVDGKHAIDFALSGHTHPMASSTVDGLMAKTDKAKLDGLPSTITTYTHPSTHSASMITETDDKNFVTKTQKTKIDNIDTNFLSKTNTTEYTPTEDYHPATKKYVTDNNFSDVLSKTTDALKVNKKINAAAGIKMDNGTTLVHNNTTIIDGTGIVYNAAYNDLAEAFEAEDISILEPGDVISYSLDGKYGKSKHYMDRTVVGVYSDTYGQLLGASGDDDLIEKGLIPIGLAGRVYVKVKGKAEVGDLLVASGIPGVACVNPNPAIGTIIGKVLENKSTEEISRIRMLIINS